MVSPIPKRTTHIYLDVPLERADLFEVVPLLLREARPRSLTRVEPPGNVNNKRDVIEHLSVPQYSRGACAQLESKCSRIYEGTAEGEVESVELAGSLLSVNRRSYGWSKRCVSVVR